jgi:hypothetical protein
MTLSVAWIRTFGTNSELIFASDSRLIGGGNVDECQKVFSLPREDCAISFCGSTDIAYPFILQLINAVSEYRKAYDRAVDVDALKGSIVDLLNRFITSHSGVIASSFEKELLTTTFLFGGWSWKKHQFYLWDIFFDANIQRYVDSACKVWQRFGVTRGQAAPIGFCGDYGGEFLTEMNARLAPQKAEISSRKAKRIHLEYEPLQTLTSMLRDPKFTDRKLQGRGLIGGAPQVLKIYPFARSVHYAVEWPTAGTGDVTLRGRRLAQFEKSSALAINPDTGMSYPVSKP